MRPSQGLYNNLEAHLVSPSTDQDKTEVVPQLIATAPGALPFIHTQRLGNSSQLSAGLPTPGIQMSDKFRIVNFPHPPSIHEQYMPLRMGNVARIVPTGTLKKFQKACEAYEKENFLLMGKARQVTREWMMKGLVIQVDFYFFAHGTRIWTQKDEARKYDTSNLVKSIEDALAGILRIDDAYFFRGSHEKAETKRSDPFVNLMLKPWKPRSFQEIKEQEGF